MPSVLFNSFFFICFQIVLSLFVHRYCTTMKGPSICQPPDMAAKPSGPLMSLGEWWHVMQGTMNLFSTVCFHTATARPCPQHVAINCDVRWWAFIDTNLTLQGRGQKETVSRTGKRDVHNINLSSIDSLNGTQPKEQTRIRVYSRPVRLY